MNPSSAKAIHSGWVLKKKKKKMQGYAKRWLVLREDGTLSYSLDPEKPPRDVIDVPHASVSSDKRHFTVHVDSGSSIFHLKMLSIEEFETWRNMLRKFLHQWGGGGAPAVPNAHTSLDRAEDLVRSSISTLQEVKATSPPAPRAFFTDVEVSMVITALEQVQQEHGALRQALARGVRGDQSVSRTGTPMTPGAAGATGAAAGGAVGIGGAAMAALALDDSDFFDADEFGGVEYQLDDGDGEGDDQGVDEDSDGEGESEQHKQAHPPQGGAVSAVTYRKELPAPVSGDEVSLFSILKKNVGKDLSTISFPVTFNCPLSMLQVAAEEYEYAPDLLERAAKSTDPVERLSLVGAFAVSGYASTAHRSSRKPFNPLLGETFECVRADRQLKFVAEKVVHRPPIIATYAEGDGWSARSWGTVKNKFWGKCLELISEGDDIVELSGGDQYRIAKPSSFMRNLLAGNKYLEHVGDMVITNLKSNERLVITFKESSLFGGSASRNHIAGTIYNGDSEVGAIKGKWDEQVARVVGKDHLQVLWEAAPFPPNMNNYYGFTYFAMSLNQITDDIKNVLPPTDSRLRPDQRALENGKVDEAEELKVTLENEQRERRKQLEAENKTYQPQWFHEGSDLKWDYGAPDGTDYFKQRQEVADGKASAWPVENGKIFEASR
ncbi:Oxysterol-binding protein 3 [Malassezia sp. CBS 17886]|nr:Oxysterol-binding protein 3 [Malassezia sp. CBS 17886]